MIIYCLKVFFVKVDQNIGALALGRAQDFVLPIKLRAVVFSVSCVTFTLKALLLDFLCKVYSTNMTSLKRKRREKREETLTATKSKAAAGSALLKGRC